MDNRFVVKTTLTKADVQALAKQQLKKNVLFMWLCCAVLLIGTVLVWVRGQEYRILLTVATAVLIVASIFMEKIMGALMYRNANKDAGETTYTFTEADIYMRCKVHEGGIAYKVFEQILETDERFFLCIQRSAFIMPKKDLVEGDLDAFRSFISAKTGKTVKRVKG